MLLNFEQIDRLIRKRRYKEALCKCEIAQGTSPSEQADVLRMRARIFARCDDYERALQDCGTIFEMGEGAIRDYYRAADYALSAGQFSQAEAWFNKVLLLGEEQNEAWFKAAAYFLLAYSQMELNQYSEAIKNLDRAVAVEPDVAMPIPSMCGLCSHQQLREEIRGRTKLKK